MNAFLQLVLISSAITLIGGCTENAKLDKELKLIIEQKNLDAEFEPDHKFTNKALADLGADLFFSPDLSIDGSVSCASCHHPYKGGADGVALPIGIGGGDSKNVGEERIKAAEKVYSKNAPKGFIPRNTPTVFNASLYKSNLFWDGRAQYEEITPGHKKIRMGFNLSPVNPTYYEENSLLQAQARMPLTSPFEMKGGLFSYKNNVEIEQSIVDFLRVSDQWCKKFSTIFQLDDCAQAITLTNLTKALAEFQSSLVFVDSPFEKYIRGDSDALTKQQKNGAILFFTDINEGGLGCFSCHSGKTFSNEKFYNLGIPASGVGTNDVGWDYGRANVDKSVIDFAFKVPSLLNISTTSPYFYNGVAATLKDAINHHQLNNRKYENLVITKIPGVEYETINASIMNSFKNNKPDVLKLLPKDISDKQMSEIVAFLESLTDPCLLNKKCMSKFLRNIIATERKTDLASFYNVPGNKKRELSIEKVNKPKLSCGNKLNKSEGKFFFTAHNSDVGIDHKKSIGLIRPGWLLDIVNHGGVSVTDVNNDCLDDLIFDAGENGLVFYIQRSSGQFTKQDLSLIKMEGEITPLIMDIDGDYKYDLFVGNMGRGPAYIAFDFLSQKNDVMYLVDITGPVINASISDIDLDGDMDIVFAFWRSFKSIRQPHIFINDGNGNLMPRNEGLILRDAEAVKFPDGEDNNRRNFDIPIGLHDMTFTPNFADIDNDGDDDLLLAADFHRSQIFRNDNGSFIDITDKRVIDDDNGMGAAIGDFDNNGLLDWYVTSIFSFELSGYTGNRLYKNIGDGNFSNIKDDVLVKENAWSWGSCAADFNNDGLQDIFYMSGYGEKLESAKYVLAKQQELSNEFSSSYTSFSQAYPKLLINKGNNKFEDMSKKVGFDQYSNARGISCFDYEQDGDIDIVTVPLEGTPILYKNHLNGLKNWLAVKVTGLSGNTESIGTKIRLYTEAGIQYREIRFENNYLSRNSSQVHFGLNDISAANKLEIEFGAPYKKTIVMNNPEINKLYIVEQVK